MPPPRHPHDPHPHHSLHPHQARAHPEPPLQLLPQVSGKGYYSYSPTDRQYGTLDTINTIVRIALDYFRNQGVEIGIGDMSFHDRHAMAPHHTHRDGKCVDIRPLRKDRLARPVNIFSLDYDREATRLLAASLLAHRNVQTILFNDAQIHRVKSWVGHDNHLHVKMRS
jgi:murein endopeptidase